jgi:Putative quorum-sensing-regulated virulence factor
MPPPNVAVPPFTDEDASFLRTELARAEGQIMPFGAWQGLPVRSLPRPYLAWCLRSLRLSPPLRKAISDVLSRPDPWAHYRPPPRRR